MNLKNTLKGAAPNNLLKRKKKGYFIKAEVSPTLFYNWSYGFRPNKSAHDALANIKKGCSDPVWFLNYDIRKAFDNVNRHIQRNIFLKLLKSLPCTRTYDEIYKMMNAGIVTTHLRF